MVHPRNCSSSNIRFIGLFYSCLAGKLGRDLVAAAGCCCTLDRTHIQPRPGHRFNLMPLLRGPIFHWWFLSQPIQLKPNHKNNQNQFMLWHKLILSSKKLFESRAGTKDTLQRRHELKKSKMFRPKHLRFYLIHAFIGCP